MKDFVWNICFYLNLIEFIIYVYIWEIIFILINFLGSRNKKLDFFGLLLNAGQVKLCQM